jgi:pantoate--beta-alanine ligase
MICHLPSPNAAKAWCDTQRSQGRSVGFVPTMGALHLGHLSLVERARVENDTCCVSIFVNPLQFDNPADYNTYPRDLQADLTTLQAQGCAMVFVGSLGQFFPEITDPQEIKTLGAGRHGDGLEGTFRPGHLDGVRTIIDRLFRTVGPAHAYFGEKDFQQTLVVSELAAEIGYPQVVVCPTVRDEFGLALSSRNALLSPPEKKQAHSIYQALLAAHQAWTTGEHQPKTLANIMVEILEDTDLGVEYAEVRDPTAWTAAMPDVPLQQAQALIAARIGRVRLIDTLRLDAHHADETASVAQAAQAGSGR